MKVGKTCDTCRQNRQQDYIYKYKIPDGNHPSGKSFPTRGNVGLFVLFVYTASPVHEMLVELEYKKTPDLSVECLSLQW